MIFGFDLDGVLYPWHLVAWHWYKNNTDDKNISFDDFWKWPGGWVAENEGSQTVLDMVNDAENYTSIKISHHVFNAVWNIANKHASTIYYITSRPVAVKDATRKYLIDNNMPQAKNLYFADEHGGKPLLVKDLECDYYAEDRPKYLEVLPEITSVFVVTTPYNTYREWDAIRVHHVMEIPEILESLNELQ
jgi:uncharacterized HAD superfamily protein